MAATLTGRPRTPGVGAILPAPVVPPPPAAIAPTPTAPTPPQTPDTERLAAATESGAYGQRAAARRRRYDSQGGYGAATDDAAATSNATRSAGASHRRIIARLAARLEQLRPGHRRHVVVVVCMVSRESSVARRDHRPGHQPGPDGRPLRLVLKMHGGTGRVRRRVLTSRPRSCRFPARASQAILTVVAMIPGYALS